MYAVIQAKLYRVYMPVFAVHFTCLGVSNRVVMIWRLFKQMNLTVAVIKSDTGTNKRSKDLGALLDSCS